MAYILNDKLNQVLDGTLTKLARYDSNTLLSSVLSLTVRRRCYESLLPFNGLNYGFVSLVEANG